MGRLGDAINKHNIEETEGLKFDEQQEFSLREQSAEKRTARIQVLVTPTEKKRLQALRGKQPESDYIRDVIIEHLERS